MARRLSVEAALARRDRPTATSGRRTCWQQGTGSPSLIDAAVSYMWAEVDLVHLWTTAPPREARGLVNLCAQLASLDRNWRERVLRQHVAVIAQVRADLGEINDMEILTAPTTSRVASRAVLPPDRRVVRFGIGQAPIHGNTRNQRERCVRSSRERMIGYHSHQMRRDLAAPTGVVMSTSISRPGSVTLVAVLAWISGVLDIIGGSLLLFQSGVDAVVDMLGGAAPLIGSGLLTILIGVAVIVLAIGLLRGSNPARVAITAFEIVSVTGSVFLAIAYPAGAVGEYFSIAAALIVIALLWTGRANAFFRS